MTREEAITIIRKEYLCVDRDCDIERSCGKCDLMMPSKEPILEAYNMAIKALKQGDVLQNVKQEISTIPLTDGDGHNGHWFRAPQAIIDDVNVIIDKFINEVEQ